MCSPPLTLIQADARSPDAAPATWHVTADVEALCWMPHHPTAFLVSSEDGLVTAFDARGGAGEPWQELAGYNACCSKHIL